MVNLAGKSVLLTGATGFLGRYVETILGMRGASVNSSATTDLTKEAQTSFMMKLLVPDFVIHCAGFNGGIIFNKKYPADIFEKNVKMGMNILKAAQENGVQKVISVMTSCAYPDGKELLNEAELWDGPPHPSVECHGLAKRTLDAYSRFLNAQYTFPAYTVAITNLYGPGDVFNERGKVVSMLIKKFVEATQQNLPEVHCMGTGRPRRELMYVGDAAEALVRSLEYYEDPTKPLNIGVGIDSSIMMLAELIAILVGYRGDIVWQTDATDGQLVKLLDSSRMRTILNYNPPTKLVDGLAETIRWYIDNKEMADARP
jgi:GDP-L-fucose synthase